MRVLVLRTDSIGDFIVFTSNLKLLREILKDDKLTLLVEKQVIQLAENCPYCDSIISFDSEKYVSSPNYRQEFDDFLAMSNFQLVINAMYTRSPVSDTLVLATGAPIKIGFQCLDRDGAAEERRRNEVVYSTLILQANVFMPEQVRNMGIVKTLGYETDRKILPEVWLRQKDLDFAEDFYRSHGINDKDIVVVVFPGGRSAKRWPLEKFIHLAEGLRKELRAHIIVSGGPYENEMIEKLENVLRAPDMTILFNRDLREQGAVYKKASLFIGNETGPLHLAIAVGTPSVALLGGGYGDRFLSYPLQTIRKIWHPLSCYHCFWKCIYAEPQCLTSIGEEEVLVAAKELLAKCKVRTNDSEGTGLTGHLKTKNNIGFLQFQVKAWEKAFNDMKKEKMFWKQNSELLEKDRDTWRKNFELLSKDLSGWKNTYEEVERDRENWKRNYEGMEKDRDTWRKNFELLSKDLSGWKNTYEEVERDRENWKRNYEGMEKDRDTWKMNYEVAEGDRENLKRNFEIVWKESEESKGSCKIMQEERNELEQKLIDILRTPLVSAYLRLIGKTKKRRDA
jgi:ADP-heptose:LPS heptosyltransferase